jgi:hypothetical protein
MTVELDAAPDAVWAEFCAELAQARAVLMRPAAPRDTLSQAEAVRYLSRLTRVALESIVDSSDPDFPRLFQMSNDIIKIGGDNPDTSYWNATIAGDRTYRIHGTRGSVPYLSFGTKANRFATDGAMVSTGELDDARMRFERDGSFEIIVSRDRREGNWLASTHDTSFLLVRQTFYDKARETPASISIECLDRPDRPAPLQPVAIRDQLRRAAAFVRVTAQSFADWTEMFMAHPNALLPWDQDIFQKVGGDPNIHYFHAYWKLAPDEAWIIETQVPGCRFWNFVLQNWWMESGDYRHIPEAWTNGTKARLTPDGRLVIVVAARDPGVGNWISTMSHLSGTALLRWIAADTRPTPTCRVVKCRDVADLLR